MTSSEELCNKLSNLQNEDDRLSTLQEMKDALLSIPHSEISRTANNLQLPLVFDCLNNSNTEQMDLACEVLSLCMNNLTLGESTNRYGVFLERALNHPYPAVKLMALNEIARNIKRKEVITDLCKRQSLLEALIKCIGDDDIEVAKKAAEIITIIGGSSSGIKQLSSSTIQKTIHEVMGKSEILRLRIYEVIIDISIKKEENFIQLKATGLFSQILNEINNEDILLKLNILELLTKFGLTKHGFNFLEENDVINRLFTFLDSDDLLGIQLCEPGILRFFGSMAHDKPILMLQKYPKLFDRLSSNLEGSKDFAIINITLDTLGYIGESNDGKIALDSKDEAMQNVIKIISKSLISYPTDTKVRALNCLENLLKIQTFNNKISQIIERWFKSIDDNPIDYIWKYAKNPFVDIRLAGFGILKAIAGQFWGQNAIKDTPGLVEFLLDRNVENKKECKEEKFEIVKLLASSSVFDHMTNKKLKEFVKEGPFFVQAVTEVAIEGND